MSRELIAAILQIKVDAAKARLPKTLQDRIALSEQTDFLLRR